MSDELTKQLFDRGNKVRREVMVGGKRRGKFFGN